MGTFSTITVMVVSFKIVDNLYSTLIHQTFNFPQEDFEVIDNELYFNKIPLMQINNK